MSFTYRASRIIEDTLNAVAQADEIEGLELEEYVRVMMVLADEMRMRARTAIDQLIAGEVQANKPHGAWANVEIVDEGVVRKVLFSFGEHEDDAPYDSYGVPDDDIFYYATGEDELKEMQKDYSYGFKVLDYELEVFEGELA